MTSRYAVMELLEQTNNHLWKHRAKLDVYIGMLARCLELGMKCDEGWDVVIPTTGGRMLATDSDTSVQWPHCDFELQNSNIGKMVRRPGYFFMISGSKGFIIWVAEGSHINQHTSDWKKAILDVKKVYVSPYSFFVGRGDVFHAGDAYNADYNEGNAIRYHTLLSPHKNDFVNEIQYFNGDSVNWIE